MKISILIVLSIFLNLKLQAQVPQISSDGKYVALVIDKGINEQAPVLVVQAIGSGWKRDFKGGGQYNFAVDNSRLFFTREGYLYILDLWSKDLDSVANVDSYIYLNNKQGLWLLYRLNGPLQTLVVRNLLTRQEQRFQNVNDFIVDNSGETLLLMIRERPELISRLMLFDLSTSTSIEIWRGDGTVDYCRFNDQSTGMAFLSVVKEGKNTQSGLFYYDLVKNQLSQPLCDTSKLLNDRFVISGEAQLFNSYQRPQSMRNVTYPFFFTADGEKLILYLKEKAVRLPDPKSPTGKIDVWSYFDARFQNEQVYQDIGVQRRYAAALDIKSGSLIRLEQNNEIVIGTTGTTGYDLQIGRSYALVCHFDQDVFNYANGFALSDPYAFSEYDWNASLQRSIFLVSLADGHRTLLGKFRPYSWSSLFYRFSPSGRFILFYNEKEGEYCSYELQTGITRKLLKIRPSSEAGKKFTNGVSIIQSYYTCPGLVSWSDGGHWVFVKDYMTDIWKLDLASTGRPVNITCSAGKNKQLTISALPDQFDTAINNNDSLLLHFAWQPSCTHAYENSGFYLSLPGKQGALKTLIPMSGSYNYQILAKRNDLSIVSRQTVKEPQQFFYTTDFKAFYPIDTDVPDERTGKGERQEVLTWKTAKGQFCQGVLYLPKDFDRSRKYPVIVLYYELGIGHPNNFQLYNKDGSVNTGDGMGDALVRFAGQGYIIFIPDIHHDQLGSVSQNVYDCVVSGTQYLKKRSYVDAARIGITGLSFGGYATNCLITHSHIFAAAISHYGYSDMLSAYLGDHLGSNTRSGHNAIGQNRMGATPWDRPDIYLKNSPVLYADRVMMPVLLQHNKDDSNIAYTQSVEFYKALRRAGKKVWLISGDTGNHGYDQQMPYYRQFFDHYLKGLPAPKWMTRGVPAREKGNAVVFEPDTAMKEPPAPNIYPDIRLTPQQQKLLKHKTKVNDAGLIVTQ